MEVDNLTNTLFEVSISRRDQIEVSISGGYAELSVPQAEKLIEILREHIRSKQE